MTGEDEVAAQTAVGRVGGARVALAAVLAVVLAFDILLGCCGCGSGSDDSGSVETDAAGEGSSEGEDEEPAEFVNIASEDDVTFSEDVDVVLLENDAFMVTATQIGEGNGHVYFIMDVLNETGEEMDVTFMEVRIANQPVDYDLGGVYGAEYDSSSEEYQMIVEIADAETLEGIDAIEGKISVQYYKEIAGGTRTAIDDFAIEL